MEFSIEKSFEVVIFALEAADMQGEEMLRKRTAVFKWLGGLDGWLRVS